MLLNSPPLFFHRTCKGSWLRKLALKSGMAGAARRPQVLGLQMVVTPLCLPRLHIQPGNLEAAVSSLPSGSQQPTAGPHSHFILLMFYRPHLPTFLFVKIKDKGLIKFTIFSIQIFKKLIQ